VVLPCCNDRVGRSEGNVAVEDRKVFKTELEMVPDVGTKEERQYLDVICIIYHVLRMVAGICEIRAFDMGTLFRRTGLSTNPTVV